MTAPDLITEARSLAASIPASGTLRSLEATQLARARMLLQDMADALETAQQPPLGDELIMLRRLLAEFADPDDDSDCRFDHHGGCQEHGHLSIEPGEMCPYAEAQQYLREVHP